jgi:probable rRNA maturation factor
VTSRPRVEVRGPTGSRALAAPLRGIVRATLVAEGRAPGEIAVVLTDDLELRRLNREWRGIDRATDVLSFAYDEEPGPSAARGRVNGDLAISLDRVRDQAKRFRVTPGAELARLVIHGALHLAGLDHQRAAERRHMRLREDAALHACRAHVRALERSLRV